ncbi:MAG: hypothetical protein KAX05_12865 [Bacteroidales bacterium]|nr:hypothetical protein [Bacteroidales bacterium]
MKRINKFILTSLLLTGFLWFGNSCADLEVENLMAPDREEALANVSDILSLLDGGMDRVYDGMGHWRNFHIDAWADQGSETNAWSGFWFFAQEPRNRIPNTSTWSDRANIEDPWNRFNAGVNIANEILKSTVDEGNQLIDPDTEVDYTHVAIATAYFLKGISQGYLGMIYDKAYVVDSDSDLSALEFAAYDVLIDNGVANLKLAWEYAAAHPFDDWRFMVGSSDYDSDDFIKIAKSYAARIMAGEARNQTDGNALDWSTINSYASAGITEDFNPRSSNTWYIWYHDWQCYLMGMKSPYLHADIKIPYYATKYFPEDEANMYTWEDNNYPWEYPTDEAIKLGPAASKDKRIGPRVVWYDDEGDSFYGVPTGEDTWEPIDPANLRDYGDFIYSPDFGYLRSARGRHLFTNHVFVRYQEQYWPAGIYDDNNYTHLMLAWEMTLLQAEAQLNLSGEAAARDVMNSSSPITNAREERGGLAPLDGTIPVIEIIDYEYCIELYSTGKYLQWISMRRWNRLKKGTPLSMPVPAAELEITGDELYSFGGSAYADGTGTADGSNAWAPLHGGK